MYIVYYTFEQLSAHKFSYITVVFHTQANTNELRIFLVTFSLPGIALQDYSPDKRQ